MAAGSLFLDDVVNLLPLVVQSDVVLTILIFTFLTLFFLFRDGGTLAEKSWPALPFNAVRYGTTTAPALMALR